MDNDKIKEAFQKAKQDIDFLKIEMSYLSQDIQEIKQTLQALLEYENHKQNLQQTNQQTFQHEIQHLNQSENQEDIENLTQIQENPTQNPLNQAENLQNTSFPDIPTQEHAHYALKQHFIMTSTGNDGVPTNQPTNQQTNQHPPISHGNEPQFPSETHQKHEKIIKIEQKSPNFDKISHLEQVSSVLSTLDNIKKELRIKFKRLTSQEMLVFSAIYSLENESFVVDYSLLAQKLSLSEISIRDYIHKLIKKGIPIIKTKENNKKIRLSISPDIKKIASLNTILSLREL